MIISLETLFEKFCKYLDGKLKWAKPKGKDWTDIVFGFFSELNKGEVVPYIEEKNYMLIDYIWRYGSRYSVNDIELAVEHEGEDYKVGEIISKEIQHLIDIKARNKVGIFYPSRGDEKELTGEISKKIKSQSDLVRLEKEEYLVILGYTTTKSGRRAVLFKGFFFNNKGDITKEREFIIFQK